jgi:DNA-binding MarR family transcriptional regulator
MENKFVFDNIIAIYRPYTKLFQPIFEEFELYPAQWLVLKDICYNAPTTLVQISKRRSIEKPTARKILKVLSEKSLLTVETGTDKREKWLSLSQEGQSLYNNISTRVDKLQDKIIENTGLSTSELEHITKSLQSIHEQILAMEEF